MGVIKGDRFNSAPTFTRPSLGIDSVTRCHSIDEAAGESMCLAMIVVLDAIPPATLAPRENTRADL